MNKKEIDIGKHNSSLWWLETPIIGKVLRFIFPYYIHLITKSNWNNESDYYENGETWWCGWFTKKVILKYQWINNPIYRVI